MPYTTVWKIVTNRIQPRKKRSDFSTHKAENQKDAEVIRRAIYNFYSKNLVPTLNMIYDQLVKDYSITYSPSTLSRFLNHIGFRYKKINKRSSIMDSPRLIKWRNEYLDAISKLRDEGRPIFYLDETWFDTHDTAQKGWTDDSTKCAPNYPINRGQRIIILNIGSKNGWLGGESFLLSAKNIKDSKLDYHKNMTSSLFKEWFEKKVLPNLPPKSVIVMDNAPYHSEQIRKIPGVETYTKKEMLEVLHTKVFEKQFVIDELAKRDGHNVLRLPPSYCVFNPIELIWSQLKESLRRNNCCLKFSSESVSHVVEEIKKISPTLWQNCVSNVTETEDNYRTLTSHIKPIIITLDNDSSKDDSDSDIEL
ncbi:uncharacterized protein LOC126885527 [Diabrotica virgifera virgifera]|uniref:Tc1-like transposase DDE domain-containing protein n=1 Tax=Diabrotica virgifera virgifera TaxID=50390 RepID=A0ABM5KD12_DIAVI|nr:uncharacterized protein LOC126885527 [Diabrotica virgifera virgifera]